MSWTDLQRESFFGLIGEAFADPAGFDVDKRRAWTLMLNTVTPADALEALQRLVRRGAPFRPSWSELCAEMRADPSQPTFAEAVQLIYGPGGVMRAQPDRPATGPVRYASEPDRRAAIDEARIARANQLHSLVTAFVARQGLHRLATLGIDDADYGPVRRRDLEREWDRHVETFDRRAVAQLAAPAGQRQLHRFDPLAALNLAPRPALTEGNG